MKKKYKIYVANQVNKLLNQTAKLGTHEGQDYSTTEARNKMQTSQYT